MHKYLLMFLLTVPLTGCSLQDFIYSQVQDRVVAAADNAADKKLEAAGIDVQKQNGTTSLTLPDVPEEMQESNPIDLVKNNWGEFVVVLYLLVRRRFNISKFVEGLRPHEKEKLK